MIDNGATFESRVLSKTVKKWGKHFFAPIKPHEFEKFVELIAFLYPESFLQFQVDIEDISLEPYYFIRIDRNSCKYDIYQ